MATARSRSRAREDDSFASLIDAYPILRATVTGFLKKKRGRALDEQLEVVYFLLQISLLLKENVFDRPEVKEFFSRSARQIQLLTRKSLGMMMPKRKRLRPARFSR